MKMKALITTIKGCEKVLQSEVKEILGIDGKILGNSLIITTDKEGILKLNLKSQSAIRVIILLQDTRFKDSFIECEKDIKAADISSLVDRSKSIAVRSYIHSNFDKQEVESVVGSWIRGYDIELKYPDVIFTADIIDNHLLFGIDSTGRSLDKREYKIMIHPSSIKGSLAYSLLRKAGITKEDNKKKIINLFCKDGIFAIEAAAYLSGYPLHLNTVNRLSLWDIKSFDEISMDCPQAAKKDRDFEIWAVDEDTRSIKAVKTNAKLAGVLQDIKVSRIDVDWLDTKFDKESIDLIISQLTNRDIKRIGEIIYQSEYILKKKGRLALFSNSRITFPEKMVKDRLKVVLDEGINKGYFVVLEK